MARDKSVYICLNHEPSLVFQTHKDPPNCPQCKSDDWVSSYSGGRSVSRTEVRGGAVQASAPVVQGDVTKGTGQSKIDEGV